MNKLLSLYILPIFLLMNALSAEVCAQAAQLQGPVAGNFYVAGEAFSIQLPGGMENSALAQLTLEVDSIDVTALAVRKGHLLVYQPVTRLAYGKHELRLVRYGQEGSVTELGFWEVEVQQSAYFRESRIQGVLNVTANQRVAENNSNANAQSPESGIQANGEYSALVETRNWRTEAMANIAYADDPMMSFTGRRADIPSFFVKSTSGGFTLNMGDHVLAAADLVNDGYQRRGISSSVALTNLNSEFEVYSASANQRIGIDGGLGLSDGENRISGARWQYQPVNNSVGQIVLTSSFLTGKASEVDFATVDIQNNFVDTVNEGDAWNVVLDGQFFEEHVRMRFENARSRYDFDGLETGFDVQEDDAWSALILFNVVTENATPTNLNLGMEKQKIGTWFKSIANKQLPADKEFLRTFVNASREKWNWNASFAEEGNNLDNNLDYARTHTDQWVIGGSFQEYDAPPSGTLLSLLGKPGINWYATGVEVADLYTPAGYLVNDLSTRSANVSAVFSYETWNWSLGLNQDTLEDHTNWQPQTRTNALMFNSSVQISKYYYLALGWQLQDTRFILENVDTRRQLYSLEARAEFIPERLFCNLSIGINQNNALEDPYYALRDKSTYASSNVTWRVKKPKNNSVGLDLSLSIQRNEFSDFINTVNDTDGYQVFFKINTILPTVLPGGEQ